MKKINLFLTLLLFSSSAFSQVIKPFSLQDFEGKKIVSLFKSTTEIKGGFPGIPITPTNQYHTVNRSMSFRKNDINILVEKNLSNIKIDVENMVTLEHHEFDTDRKFDRPSEFSMVYGKYDNFIDKPFKMIFNSQNIRIDTLLNFKDDNSVFERAWSDDRLPFLQEFFLGFFQMSLPLESTWKVGQTWEQVIKRKIGSTTKNETITNIYTVKQIVNNDIIIEVKGVNIPELVIYKRGDGYVNNSFKNNKVTTTDKINYTVEQKAEYEGIIKLDSKNNFIQKMDISTDSYKKIFVKDSPPSGPENTYKVTIENKLEDLK